MRLSRAAKATSLSRAQLTRLVRQFLDTGRVADRRGGAPVRPFERRYTAADIHLLADVDGNKGVYLINAVDEVTQFEFVGAVAAISERFLIPVLTGMLDLFPFAIHGLHADNGSEYVNRRVANLLAKLHVEFTKSRPRRSNDNALVEGKNANVGRRWLGHAHIPQRFAPQVNAFVQFTLSPAVNFHRPCMFPVEHVDDDGRIRKRYPHDHVQTPYERFKSLDGAARLLKPGVTFDELDAAAYAMSDLAAMRRVNRARDELFRAIAAASDTAKVA